MIKYLELFLVYKNMIKYLELFVVYKNMIRYLELFVVYKKWRLKTFKNDQNCFLISFKSSFPS